MAFWLAVLGKPHTQCAIIVAARGGSFGKVHSDEVVSLGDYIVYNVFINYGVSLAVTLVLFALAVWVLHGFVTCTMLIFKQALISGQQLSVYKSLYKSHDWIT